MSVRGVVFDYGGVLARWPELSDFEPVAGEIGFTWNMYQAGFAKYRRSYDASELSCEDMYRNILNDNSLFATDEDILRLCRADDESWAHPIPETLLWMKELKAAGMKIGILTNMAANYYRDWFLRCFAEHVAVADAIVVSGVEGKTKPSPAIYHLMEERLGLVSDEIVFMDDMLKNVEAAEALGWLAFGFTDVPSARTTLDELIKTNRTAGMDWR